jgi:hypothetical protein
MVTIFDVVQTIATVIGAFSVFFIWRQIKADHERSRREKSLALMSEWNSARFRNGQVLASVITLVEHISEKQCRSLWNRELITVSEDLEAHIKSIGAGYNEESSIVHEANGISIAAPLIGLMRDDVAHYLNSLEIIATAWRHHAVDRDIIEEEFIGIFSKQKNSFPYDFFRKASGVYPSIHQLQLAIEVKENKRINKKAIA